MLCGLFKPRPRLQENLNTAASRVRTNVTSPSLRSRCAASLDHLVGELLEMQRHFEAECFGAARIGLSSLPPVTVNLDQFLQQRITPVSCLWTAVAAVLLHRRTRMLRQQASPLQLTPAR